MLKWRIVRHVRGASWLIYCDEKFFCSFATRAQAREYVKQQRALDALANEHDDMIKTALWGE